MKCVVGNKEQEQLHNPVVCYVHRRKAVQSTDTANKSATVTV